jgi:internalin A
LDFTMLPFTDRWLVDLRWLKNLQALNLAGRQVTGAGLKELAALKKLQGLYLRGTQITDAGLKELTGLNNLQTLNLSKTHITDAGLKELAALRNLQVSFLNDGVTGPGVEELRKALPNCDIWKPDGSRQATVR